MKTGEKTAMFEKFSRCHIQSFR